MSYWVLELLADPGLRNDPATEHLGKFYPKQYIGDDVSPRDVFHCVGLDDSSNLAFYKDVKWSMKKNTDEFITVEPDGPGLQMDVPIVAQ